VAIDFSSFSIGDVATFEKTFTENDFASFSSLSGDYNPLHHDSGHAAKTDFGKPIVPLHLTIAPFSMIAGMVFPGEPSLYLGHEVRAAKPVFYGDCLHYSARIASISASNRILTIRVLAIRDSDVVLDAEMRVQATTERWETEPSLPIIRTSRPSKALVTGASGEIGRAIALALASRGWSLLLHDRKPDEQRRSSLSKLLDRQGCDYTFIDADLAIQSGIDKVNALIREHADIDVIAHTASAGVAASLEELVTTNYAVVKGLSESALPHMLARQQGRFLFISSTAMIRGVPGWDDYVAAKTMTTGFVSGLDQRFTQYGVRFMSLLPGIVATPFSEPYRGDQAALLPEEVAEAAVEMIESPSDGALVLEVGRKQSGRYGLSFADKKASQVDSENTLTPIEHAQKGHNSPDTLGAISESLANLIRKKFRLNPNEDIAGGGLGATPGWDSLSQIELVLEIERAFGLSFTSQEIALVTTYADLLEALSSKIGL
jgi:short-subunit dehydrogenase/acyl dehydratase/acyl carrier protein